MTHRIPALSTALDDVRRQFERWREAHPPRTRIPEALWSRVSFRQACMNSADVSDIVSC
jgi:hypothetical protein